LGKWEWPASTGDEGRIPGRIKARDEDFVVDEIPAYLPSGEGDHVYFTVEKRGLTTMRAARDISRALGVKSAAVGLAGQKDALGITRQLMSVEHVDPAAVQALELRGITISGVTRHRNKLKTGHLKGNRFAIRVRDTEPARAGEVAAALDRLARDGATNYFGEQRFGARGDTGEVGRALIRGRFQEAADIICGRPGPDDEGDVLAARELFAAGRLEEAAAAWPRGYGDSARLCRELSRRPDAHRRAVMSMDQRLLSIYVSAYQSALFNRVVAARVGALGIMQEGDLAWKHDKGVVFQVTDAAVDNERAARGEISPSGPLFGQRMSWPAGAPGEAEAALLAGEGLTIEDFPASGALRCTGGRRPLRFFPGGPSAEGGQDEHGPFVEVRFSLDPGCYATVLLREIFRGADQP